MLNVWPGREDVLPGWGKRMSSRFDIEGGIAFLSFKLEDFKLPPLLLIFP